MNDLTRELLRQQNECTFGWTARDGRRVSLQGRCRIEDDPAARKTFFEAFSRAVLPNGEKGAAAMLARADSL